MLTASGVRPHLIKPGFDSVQWEFIKEKGKRQAESVNVAHVAAEKRGEDPQGSCVAYFPFHISSGKGVRQTEL